jgi:sugar lactone lactonase YvrE
MRTRRSGGVGLLTGLALLFPSAAAGAESPITTIADGLAQPRTAAVATNGDIYFTDTYHHQVGRLDASGAVTTIAGNGYAGKSGDGGAATEASLDTPHGVAVDNRGHVYIADSPNHRIRMVDLASGTIRTVTGTGAEGYSGDGGPATAAKLNRPRFLVVAADGSLIVADTANYRVRRIDPAGIITTIAGTGEKGYSGDGGPATAARLDDPRGLAFDAAGNLYVSNAEGSPVPTVRRIDRAGTITTVAGGKPKGFAGDGGPATEARLNEPRSIAIFGSTLYIADSLNDRIRAVDLGTGIIRTVASGLGEPRGVAVMPGGDVIIADTGNDRLRRIDLGGAAAGGGPAAPPQNPPSKTPAPRSTAQGGGEAANAAPGAPPTTAGPTPPTTRAKPARPRPAAPAPAEPVVVEAAGLEEDQTAPTAAPIATFGEPVGNVGGRPLRLWNLAGSAR